jgi:hypothetical protein
MNVMVIRRIVEVFIAIFAIGAVSNIWRGIRTALSDEFGQLHWPLQAADAAEHLELGGGGAIHLTHGVITVSGQPMAQLLDMLVDLSAIGLFIIALLALRKLLIRFAWGDPFNHENADGLRKIGLALLVICALSVAQVLILQPIILAAAQMPAGMVLHPSISWDVAGMKNVWLDYEVPIFTFVLGGIAMLFSQAFKIGMAFREDSESVV